MKEEQLKRRYALETDILRLEQQSEALAQAIRQAKFDQRSSKEKLLTYEGSVRHFFDGFSGKREQTLESLRREVRSCEAALASRLREKEALDYRRAELTEALQTLPTAEALRTGAEPLWAALEAEFCAEALTPLLEENHKALMQYRAFLRGEHPEILSPQRQQEICTEPDLWAKKCRPYLLRLKEAKEVLGTPIQLGSYYDSPAAYLSGVAAKHNRMDRVNQALDQVEAVQRLVRNRK